MQERIKAIHYSQNPFFLGVFPVVCSVYKQNTMRMLKQNRADHPTDNR